uniref:Protein phosphatase 1 regulatory subunit 26 n=1 Tax=Latimeria chalumnae TaxID=7897 RepID=H3BGC8_LATCH
SSHVQVPFWPARMFLMNAPPVAALQTKWRLLGPSSSSSIPICFSESEEEISGTPLEAKVQFIIEALNSAESSIDMNNESENSMQKNTIGEKSTDGMLVGGPIKIEKSSEYSMSSLLSNSDGTEEEDCPEFGPLAVNSDSDDSVDRDIEEAIQEYLKNKTEAGHSLAENAKCPNESKKGETFKKEPAENCILPIDVSKIKSGKNTESNQYDKQEADELPKCSSPSSVSSDDSFEQSIQAEIVNFLNEKRQKEATQTADKNLTYKTNASSEKSEEKEAQGKSRLHIKKGTEKTNSNPVSLGCKVAPAKQYTEKVFEQDIITEETCKYVNNPAAVKGPKADHAVFCAKKNFQDLFTNGSKVNVIDSSSAEQPDSSSDDGIEEAIQLYQLEKKKREGVTPMTVCSSLLNQQFQAETSCNLLSGDSKCEAKSTACEKPQKPLGKKRKHSTKSNELNSMMVNDSNGFENNKGSLMPMNKIAKQEVKLGASCRAETSAELMCAEAILDISKTVVPPEIVHNVKEKASPTQTIFHSKNVPYYTDSDSSSVDSDDSIEQEIRNFLALKAQTNSQSQKDANGPPKAYDALSPEQMKKVDPNETSLPRTLKLSLSRKRRKATEDNTEGVCKVDPQNIKKEMPCPASVDSSMHTFCSGNGSAAKQSKTEQQCHPDVLMAITSKDSTPHKTESVHSVDDKRELSKGHSKIQENYPTDDKSSSLDSDEDLDTAIKELLRSKKKVRKKSKDPKPQFKKKVQFGEAETKEKGDTQTRTGILKSCLIKSSKDISSESTASKGNKKMLDHSKTEICSKSSGPFGKQHNKPKTFCTSSSTKDEGSIQVTNVVTDDSSGVDSDDSIEQEIRKFLAEKARES